MSIDWPSVRLVVFDVDGTLYDQPPLRRAMAWELTKASAREGHLRTIFILHAFRRVRERLGKASGDDFIDDQFHLAAQASGYSETEVRDVVGRWIDRAPLTVLPRYKAQGIDRLFDVLRWSGRQIAAWSDYPVRAKLDVLGLAVDHDAWAGDDAVGRLKPDPAGLAHILDEAGVPASETLVIGDRFDRDWAGASALGVRTLIRSRRPDPRSPTFTHYGDPLFAPLLHGHSRGLGR